MIRNVEINDAGAICEIYNYYIQNTVYTFEEHPVTVNDMQDRITRKVLLLDHNDVILTTIRFSGYSLRSGLPRASRMEVFDHATGQTSVFDLEGLSQPINPLTLI